MAGDIMSSDEFQKFRVTNPGQSEIIRQRLYDYQLYATAGAQQLSFFNAPIGQGKTTALGATAGTPKTQWDTNMNLGGQLPSGTAYLAESIEVVFYAGSVSTADTFTQAALSVFNAAASAAVAGSVNDVNAFYLGGMLEFNILQKNYVRETPLLSFPPKAALQLSAAAASTSATASEVAQILAVAGGRPYYLDPKITLQPAVNFEILLKWPAVVATPSGFNGRVGVLLDGYIMRASQ